MVNSKLVVEKKKEVLLDWRGNEKKEEEELRNETSDLIKS